MIHAFLTVVCYGGLVLGYYGLVRYTLSVLRHRRATSHPELTLAEQANARAVLVDAYCERFQQQPTFLQNFLEATLSEPATVKRAILERGQRDPASMEERVVEAVRHQDDRALLASLVQQWHWIEHSQLGFNPLQRERQSLELKRLKHRQRYVVLTGAVALLLMLLFPPCKREIGTADYLGGIPLGGSVHEEQMIGHRFILTANSLHEHAPRPKRQFLTSYQRVQTLIALDALAAQALILMASVLGALVCLRPRETFSASFECQPVRRKIAYPAALEFTDANTATRVTPDHNKSCSARRHHCVESAPRRCQQVQGYAS